MALGLVRGFGAEACHFIALAGPGLVAQGWAEKNPEMSPIEDASILNVMDKAVNGIVASIITSALISTLSKGRVKVVINCISLIVAIASVYSRVLQHWEQYQQLPKTSEEIKKEKKWDPSVKQGKLEKEERVEEVSVVNLSREKFHENIYVDVLTFIFLATAGLWAKSLSPHFFAPR